MSTALAPLAPSLFELESDLQALIDSSDLLTRDSEDPFFQEFQRDLSEALQKSTEKRDRVGQFITHCVGQAENCDKEIARLTARKLTFQRAEKRMRQYVQSVIELLGTDEKGRYKKLDGKTVTFSLRINPPSVAITDEDVVPDEYKTITVTLPLTIWGSLVQVVGVPELSAVIDKAKLSTSKTAIREAIDAGLEVPGADLNIGGHTLVVK